MRNPICALLVAAAVSCAAAPPFSLEQIMSRPFASELTAGPGARVAWIVNREGVRNIWAAAGPDFRARQITKFTEDDGMDIGQLEWLPDGRGLVFVRGGDLEWVRAEFPNPLSKPEGVEQSIYFATVDGVVRKLADGYAPRPAGPDRLVFLKGNQVMSIAIAASDAKPVTAAKLRGSFSALQPSPDGSAVAFVTSRQTHSFVGVYRFADKSVVYLDPSVDMDASPVWSADGKQVAFIRIAARSRTREFGPVRSAADPWSIRVAVASTGAGRQVWKAAAGPGSAFHPLPGESLMWAAGNRLVFPWERDKWAHLYSVSADGGDAVLLTPGEFEVEHASLSPDRAEVIYSSNQDDIDRRHIWRVRVNSGSRPARVTSGSGIEWSPALLDGGAIAMIRSDARMPAQAAVSVGGSIRNLASETVPASFPAAALVEPQPVMISAADGMSIHGQLFLPRDASSSAKRPALIFFHGGSRRQMLLGWHYMYYYDNAYALNQYLASLGYVVLSVNYRSGIGYGMEFREALNYGIAGASEYNDVIGAGLYLRNRADVDPKRIGLWGGSYGGYLTALGLARGSDLFAAGVDFHGVHDWSKLRTMEANSPEARLAFESSPMAAVKTWRSPVLLIHGDDDRNVPFAETVRLVEALRAQKVDFEQIVYPDEIHDFLTHRHWVDAYRATADFFARKMK